MSLVFWLWACQSGPESLPTSVPAPQKQPAPPAEPPVDASASKTTEVTAVTSVDRMIYFTHQANFASGQGEFLAAVPRSFAETDGPQKALELLYTGPLSTEVGLVLTSCGTTGAELVAVEGGLAYVHFQGECGDCGAHSIYDSIQASLKEWPEISGVVAFGPDEKVQTSIKETKRPRCLEP